MKYRILTGVLAATLGLVVASAAMAADTATLKGKFVLDGKAPAPTPLTGTKIEVPDIRAGMAHVIAALVAEGESQLTGVHHLERGYERLWDKLRALGADFDLS